MPLNLNNSKTDSSVTAKAGGYAGESSLRKSLEKITLEGNFAMVFIVLTGGPFLTGLAIYLGASDFEIGLLAAIPFLAQIAQLAAAYLVDLTGKRKLITLQSLVFARQIWWILLPLPFLEGQWRLKFFLLVVVLSQIAAMMGAAGWTSWVADLVPDRIRGRYFGFRSASLALVTVVATMMGGAILDYYRALNIEGYGFAVIIGLGAIAGFGAFLLMKLFPESSVPPSSETALISNLFEPLKDKRFRHLMGIFFFWNFALGISAAFFTAHMLLNLKMSFTLISLYASAGSMVAILLNKPWGAIIDRFGSKPVITICAFGLSIIPMIWWIPRPGHLEALAFEVVYSGALWSGFNLAAFNIPIANSPKSKRTGYLAMFAVISGLGFFLSSLLGGLLAESWQNLNLDLGFQTLINYHFLFAISAVLRLATSFLMLGFREKHEKSMSVMLKYIMNRQAT